MKGPNWGDSSIFEAAQESAAKLEQDRWRERFMKEFGPDAYDFLRHVHVVTEVVDAEEVVDADS